MTARTAEGVRALADAPVGRLLWHGTAQATMSVGIYGIYALTNAAFVAHGVGPTAMGAVNLVAPVLLVLSALSTTVGVGGASLVSRRLGAGTRPARRGRPGTRSCCSGPARSRWPSRAWRASDRC
nr:hypothetical protein GCM10025732_44650 [Glycomyces mayteni]